MAEPDFLFQGPTSRTHAEQIKRFLALPGIEKVIFSVAFVNEEGVRLIEDALRPFASKSSVFAGIRNEITSIQGLARLLDLGVTLYVVDTGARNIVFHPKIYLIKAENRAGTLAGSANLTRGGLNSNVEASFALEMDLTNQKDKDFTDTVESQLMALPEQYPDNVQLVVNERQLELLSNNGLLLDEAEISPPRPLTQRETPDSDIVPRIRLVPTIQPRIIRRTRTRVPAETVQPNEEMRNATAIIPTNLELLWESKPLTERDLTIPSGANTHRTGQISLDKGKLDAEIDLRHYFRDEIFDHLTWTARSGALEEAFANFALVIKGISYGEFRLSIKHNTDTTRRTYLQHNAMTRLSWGDMRRFIANRNLIGRSLSIYRDVTNPERFVIEID